MDQSETHRLTIGFVDVVDAIRLGADLTRLGLEFEVEERADQVAYDLTFPSASAMIAAKLVLADRIADFEDHETARVVHDRTFGGNHFIVSASSLLMNDSDALFEKHVFDEMLRRANR